MQDAGCKKQDAGFRIQDAKMQEAGGRRCRRGRIQTSGPPKKMNVEHRTLNGKPEFLDDTSNERNELLILIFHSMLDVGPSMFDVHSLLASCILNPP